MRVYGSPPRAAVANARVTIDSNAERELTMVDACLVREPSVKMDVLFDELDRAGLAMFDVWSVQTSAA